MASTEISAVQAGHAGTSEFEWEDSAGAFSAAKAARTCWVAGRSALATARISWVPQPPGTVWTMGAIPAVSSAWARALLLAEVVDFDAKS